MSSQLSIGCWKKIKQSGHFKRKLRKNYLTIINSELSTKENVGDSAKPEAPAVINDGSFKDDEQLSRRAVPDFGRTIGLEEQAVDDLNGWTNELENLHDDENTKLVYFNEESNTAFRNKVRIWAGDFNIRHTALKSLISIINNRWPNTLPQDPRTLLKTPREVIIWNVGAGQYWHHGFRVCIEGTFHKISKPTEILININIDGLPTYKSSKDEFWPILFNIHGMPNLRPMAIGIYCGKGKPTDLNAFLSPFVQELKQVLEHGIFVNGYKITVKIRCFICDSPARAFVKGVCNFNGQHGCQKCTTVGEYSYISHCNVFPKGNCEKRTDGSFRSKVDECHHKQDTPLLDLPIDMVQDFIVADSLHLLDLGLMKRSLLGWRDGSLGTYRTKWSAREIASISSFLLKCKMPSEMHRAIRGLDCLAYWKGLEYRTFLHYIGIVILKYYLPNDVYQHFLSLFCAVTICSSKQYSNCLDLAQTLLEHYVEIYRDLYGECYLTSNVHNLTHLVDDVKRFGILNSFNAYPFESKLYQIKNLIRTGSSPLVQVAKRLGEMSHGGNEINPVKEFPVLKNKIEVAQINNNASFETTEAPSFSSVQLEHYILNNTMENKWFLTNRNEIVSLKFAFERGKSIYINGSKLKNITNFFETPIKSCYLNIYESNCEESRTSNIYMIKDIKCKLVAIQDTFNNKTVFIPLLHTIL